MSDPKVTIRVAQRGAKQTAAEVEKVAEAQRDVARESEAAAKALERQAAAASRSTTAAKTAAAAGSSISTSATSATAAIGNLSESLDRGLENSVGRAFKATDRLNSIVGQVTGAIGLASLAVAGITTAYTLATKALKQNTKAQEYANSIRNQATREIDAYLAAYAKMPGATAAQAAAQVKESAAIEQANKRLAESAALLQAAKDARNAALVSLRRHNLEREKAIAGTRQYRQASLNQRAAIDRLAQAQRMVTRAGEDYAGANRVLSQTLEGVRQRQLRTAQASLALGQVWARFGTNATKAGRGLLNVAVPGLNQVIDLVSNKKALADAEKFGAQLRESLGLDFSKPPKLPKLPKLPTPPKPEQSLAQFVEGLDRDALNPLGDMFGESSPLATLFGESSPLATLFGEGSPVADSMSALRDTVSGAGQAFMQLGSDAVNALGPATRATMQQQKAAVAMTEAMTASAQSYASAALSAALYGGSISQAINATARAAFVEGTVGALGALAKAAVFSIINPPGVAPMLAAAKMYAAQAAVAGAIAAGTGGIAGGGGGGGGSTAITEPTPADFGEPEQRERQDSEMFINFASGQSGRPVSRADAGAIVGALVDLARSGGYRLEARRA